MGQIWGHSGFMVMLHMLHTEEGQLGIEAQQTFRFLHLGKWQGYLLKVVPYSNNGNVYVGACRYFFIALLCEHVTELVERNMRFLLKLEIDIKSEMNNGPLS